MCVNSKYDDNKMNPFMSDRCKCECFVRPEIPSYASPLQSSTCLPLGKNYSGPLISSVIHIRCHIRFMDKWNLSFKIMCVMWMWMMNANATKNWKQISKGVLSFVRMRSKTMRKWIATSSKGKTGPLISFIIGICRHICITHKWNLSLRPYL